MMAENGSAFVESSRVPRIAELEQVIVEIPKWGCLALSKNSESIPQISLGSRFNPRKIGSIIPGHGKEGAPWSNRAGHPMKTSKSCRGL
jgi:hypothetical protein